MDDLIADGGSVSRDGSWLTRYLGMPGRPRELLIPVVLLVVQLAGAAATVTGQHGPARHLQLADWLLLVLGPLALVVRRRWPVAVLWVTFAATLTPSAVWSANLSLIVAFFLAASSGHRRAAWGVVVVGYVSSVWLVPLARGNRPASLAFAMALAGWLGVLVIAAEVVRLRQERSAESRAARELDASRRVSEERLRAARDLHDVIGHNISLINVQAAVALDLMSSRPEQARIALVAIESASRDALNELRTMLETLRHPGEVAPRSPAPSLDRVEELVELTRAAGIGVSIATLGERRALPAAVDLAAYRILQESLTNVARHSAQATACVRLTYRADGLDIEVTSTGRQLTADSPVRTRSGTGIDGMRERATALGGRLDAGPRPAGGFVVTAHLPLVAQP
jgi:signal transduction histidine kinase